MDIDVSGFLHIYQNNYIFQRIYKTIRFLFRWVYYTDQDGLLRLYFLYKRLKKQYPNVHRDSYREKADIRQNRSMRKLVQIILYFLVFQDLSLIHI